MKIFLITDIHHGDDTNYSRVGGDLYINSFWSALSENIGNLRPIIESCDLVINLGDMIHNDNAERDLIHAQEVVQFLKTNTPIRHVYWNHDEWYIDRKNFNLLVGGESTYYSFDQQGYHHVILDANRFDRWDPYVIPPEQIEWLSHDLEKTSCPTIIYIHHPIDEQSMENNGYFCDRPERAFVQNKKKIREILEKSGKVLAVFNGHTHFLSEQKIRWITYYTIPSFAENDTTHRPNLQFAIAVFEKSSIDLQIQSMYNPLVGEFAFL